MTVQWIPDEDLDFWFNFAGKVSMPFWLLCLGAPLGSTVNAARRGAARLLVPVLLAPLYLCLFIDGIRELDQGLPDFNSLAGVTALFGSQRALLAGWIHYLVFDLFVASAIVDDARSAKQGLPHLFVVPCLVLVLMAGPTGLLCYLVLKHLWHASWLRRGSYLLVALTSLFSLVNRFMASFGNLDLSQFDEAHPQRHFIEQYQSRDVGPAFVAHWAVSVVWLALAAVQVSRAEGTRGTVHQLVGYVTVALGLVSALGPVYYSYTLSPDRFMFAHPYAEIPVIAIYVVVQVVSLFRAVAAARASRFAEHRRWMLRAVGTSLGVGAQRVYMVLANVAAALISRNAEYWMLANYRPVFIATLLIGLATTLTVVERFAIPTECTGEAKAKAKAKSKKKQQ